jgi:integrase
LIKIKKEVLKDGTVRYRARGVSVGKDPLTGRRAQRTITCRTKHEVEAELKRIGHAVDRGTYTKPWDGLVPELIDSYLRNGADQWEANTRLSYSNALQPAREYFAHRKARSVVREDVEALKSHLLTSGRRRGGKAGTALSPRSVNLSLGQLQAAFDLAERDGKVARNPVRFVRRVKRAGSARSTWSEDEARRFLKVANEDRMAAAWRLSMLGVRRGEVIALRWDDVNLASGTISIGRSRVLVGGKVIEKSPKSERGYRVLPLDAALTTALRALRKRQAAERLEAGPAYEPSGYVVVDELGAPVHPERFTDEFHRLAALAGCPRIRLHDGRHTTNSLMAAAGIPDHIRAAWCGHTVAVNVATYTHARPEDLVMARDALSKIYSAL